MRRWTLKKIFIFWFLQSAVRKCGFLNCRNAILQFYYLLSFRFLQSTIVGCQNAEPKIDILFTEIFLDIRNPYMWVEGCRKENIIKIKEISISAIHICGLRIAVKQFFKTLKKRTSTISVDCRMRVVEKKNEKLKRISSAIHKTKKNKAWCNLLKIKA